MSRTASLPMYRVPPKALTTFWQGLRRHMIAAGLANVPEALAAPDDLGIHWLEQDLLLSQTCGYPLTTSLAGRVRYVATPCYEAAGCDGPFYSSVLIIRADDPAVTLRDMAGRIAAFNSRDSQSGHNAFAALIAPHASAGRFFGGTIETGSHRASIAAVGAGHADIAAIDAVTYALAWRDEPETVAGLRVMGLTEPAPGLPFVTARDIGSAELERLRGALRAAVADPALAEARHGLLLRDVEILPADAYAVIPAMRHRAVEQDYPELA